MLLENERRKNCRYVIEMGICCTANERTRFTFDTESVFSYFKKKTKEKYFI